MQANVSSLLYLFCTDQWALISHTYFLDTKLFTLFPTELLISYLMTLEGCAGLIVQLGDKATPAYWAVMLSTSPIALAGKHFNCP